MDVGEGGVSRELLAVHFLKAFQPAKPLCSAAWERRAWTRGNAGGDREFPADLTSDLFDATPVPGELVANGGGGRECFAACSGGALADTKCGPTSNPRL